MGNIIRALRKIERYTADAVEIWNGMDLYRTGSFGELGGGRDFLLMVSMAWRVAFVFISIPSWSMLHPKRAATDTRHNCSQ